MPPSRQTLKSRLKRWLPSIAWAILISLASTDTFSSVHTSGFIVTILHWLFPAAGAETLERLHFFIRKCAHITEYFIFGILLFRALRGENYGWQLRWAIWALLSAAGYSALDEYHQSFVPSRTASPWDSLLDTTGASVSQIVLWICLRLFSRQIKTQSSPQSTIQNK